MRENASLSGADLGRYVENLKVKHGKNNAENSLHSLQMPDDEWMDNINSGGLQLKSENYAYCIDTPGKAPERN